MKVKKYKNKKPIYKGIKFDSNAELARYKELEIMFSKGLINNLELQKRYDLIINGLKICSYIADFVYNLPCGKHVVEDVKGIMTDVFRLKYKMMFACHGIELLLTQAVYRQRNNIKYIAGFKVIKAVLPKEVKKTKAKGKVKKQ